MNDPYAWKGNFFDTDYCYAANISTDGDKLTRLYGANTSRRNGYQTEAVPGIGPVAGAKIKITRDEAPKKETIYEMAIPRTEISLFHPEDKRLRFGFILYNDEGLGTNNGLSWSEMGRRLRLLENLWIVSSQLDDHPTLPNLFWNPMAMRPTLSCLGFALLAWCAVRALPMMSLPALRPRRGIFGIGFTNMTRFSARLVFTTSEPMSTAITIFDHDHAFARLSESSFDEVHAIDLNGLSRAAEYHITITAVTRGGKSITSDNHLLKPVLRPPSNHIWPGYTIFGTSVMGDGDSGLDLLTQSGVRMVRIEASWGGVFPKNGEINHTYLDHLLRQIGELKKRGIEPLVVLDYCVPWPKLTPTPR